jgi:excisionase family DNA binding protein
MQTTDDLLTPQEAMQALRISDSTLVRWVASGRLPALYLPSGYRRFRRADVEALLTERKPA